jgi:hypothetical protein
MTELEAWIALIGFLDDLSDEELKQFNEATKRSKGNEKGKLSIATI